MRYIFITLIFCYTSITLANWFPFGKEGASTSWTSKAACEQAEEQKCFNIKGKKLSIYKIGFLEPVVDQTLDCESSKKCQELVGTSALNCQADKAMFDEKSKWPGLDFGDREGEWFLWCQVEGLVLDSDKVAADEAQKLAKEQEKALRDQKAEERGTAKDACLEAINGGSNLNQGQIKDCIGVLIKEVYSDKISADKL